MAQGTTKGVPIDTDPSLSANSDLLVPSQKAIKTYVDANASVGHTIQDAGVNETQRTNLNFQRMLVTDDAGNNATVVTRPADTFAGTTAPTSPVVGDVWTNTNTWKTYKYYDSFWVEYGVVNSSIRARRHDFVSSYSYCGTAPYGSSESSAVWKIVRILVASNGSVTSTATALNVTWTGRLTHTYT